MNRLNYIKSLLGFSIGAVLAKDIKPEKQIKPVKKDYNVIFIGGPFDGETKKVKHSFYNLWIIPYSTFNKNAIVYCKKAEYSLLRIKNNIATYIYSVK